MRERDQIGRRAGVDEQRVGHVEVVGDAGLELLGEAAGGQVEVEARVDEVPQLLLVEHAPGVADGILRGVEGPASVTLVVVGPASSRICSLPSLMHSFRGSGDTRRRSRPGQTSLSGGGLVGAQLVLHELARTAWPGRRTRDTTRPCVARPRRVPDRRPSQLLPRLAAVEAQQAGLVRLRRHAAVNAVHEPAPHSARNASTTQRTARDASSSAGPKFHGPPNRGPVAREAGGEPQVARERLEHVLPRPDGVRVADDDGLAGRQRAHAVGDDAVGRPVAAADDVAGAAGGDGGADPSASKKLAR